MKRFGLMMDCSRNAVAKPSYVKEWIDRLADVGMNTLMLYTEDTYEVQDEPYFGYQRGRYTQEELRELDEYAASRGVEMIPCIQTLAHVSTIFRWPAYRDMHDCDDIMLCEDARTYELIEHMFASVAETFRTKTIHIGMDEAHMIGRGKYFDLHGAEDHTEILLRHLEKVARIAGKYGFTLIMWSDMFFRLSKDFDYLSDKDFPGIPEDIKARIPESVELVYWDYYYSTKAHYDHQFDIHDMVKKTNWFAGGLWTWCGFAAHNQKSFSVGDAAFSTLRERNIENVILTMWGDGGAETSFIQALPGFWYDICLSRGITDANEIRESFRDKFSISFDDFLLLDLPDLRKEGAPELMNPDKFMLYNDPFMGLFDDTAVEGGAALYAACADKLAYYLNHPQYGYLYRQQYYLCKVLSRKYDLSIRIHKAYKLGDKAKLREIATDMSALLTDLDAFYRAFEARWSKENKPFGFEVHDARLGGLEKRLKHCQARLLEYADEKTESIPELEQAQLSRFRPGDEIYCNQYNEIITPSRL